MQRIQRKVGAFQHRAEDDAQAAAMLAGFNEVEQMLGKLIDATSQWREAWAHLLTHKLHVLVEFEALYKPVAAVTDTSMSGHVPVEVPPDVLERTCHLKRLYEELKSDVMEEVTRIDRRLIKPATEAKQSIKPMHKIIQKREDKKLDYERYKSRVEKLENQANRSARDDSSLAKQRIDMERCESEYHSANNDLSTRLPSITAAVISLLPFLLATQIEIQNHLLGSLYTVQHEFCQEYGFPSPPPEMEHITAQWDAVFTPLRKQIESSWELLMHSKVVHQPMHLPEPRHGTVTGLNIRNTTSDKLSSRPRIAGRIASSPHSPYSTPSPKDEKPPPPKPPRPRSSLSHAPPSPDPAVPPPINLTTRPKIPAASKPRVASASSHTLTPRDATLRRPTSASSLSPARPYSSGSQSRQVSDYFGASSSHHGNGVSPTITTTAALSPLVVNGVPTPLQGIAAGIAAKKKKPPPPPPPKKRSNSSQKENLVTALYDFQGQGPGDLCFREGDRITVLKMDGDKKDSWWEGELRGVKGSFPANYCQ